MMSPRGEQNSKRRPMAGLALHSDLAAVQHHNSPTFRESKAQTAARFAAREERVEYFIGDLGRNAGTIVGDGDFGKLGIAIVQDADLDVATSTQCFQRIDAQRPQCHMHLHWIGVDQNRIEIKRPVQNSLLFCRFVGQLGQHFDCQLH